MAATNFNTFCVSPDYVMPNFGKIPGISRMTPSKTGVFNLLSSRANLHFSHNPAGCSHCRLQNDHEYIKHHHRGMGGSPGDVGEVPTAIHLRHSSFSNPSAALPTSHPVIQTFRCFNYVIGTSPTSQLILQPFRRFTYTTAHSPTLPALYLRHSSFYSPSVDSPRHRHFTYVTARSPTLPPLYLHHSLFYNPSAASPTSQVILQPFCCFTYVTGTSRTSSGELPMHRGMRKQSVVD